MDTTATPGLDDLTAPGLDDLTAPQRARVAALTFARQLTGITGPLTGCATTCDINDMMRAARFILTGDEFHDVPTDDDLTPEDEDDEPASAPIEPALTIAPQPLD